MLPRMWKTRVPANQAVVTVQIGICAEIIRLLCGLTILVCCLERLRLSQINSRIGLPSGRMGMGRPALFTVC